MNKLKLNCLECGAPLECMCVIGADESTSKRVERLWNCNECGSAWSSSTNETTGKVFIERVFWG